MLFIIFNNMESWTLLDTKKRILNWEDLIPIHCAMDFDKVF